MAGRHLGEETAESSKRGNDRAPSFPRQLGDRLSTLHGPQEACDPHDLGHVRRRQPGGEAASDSSCGAEEALLAGHRERPKEKAWGRRTRVSMMIVVQKKCNGGPPIR